MAKLATNGINDLVYIQSMLKAPKSQRNNFGGYNYRSCEDIMEAVKPLLTERNCALTVCDEIVQVADRIYVKATAVLHLPNGEAYTNTAYAREAESKKGMDDSQVTGAASSYARKYALNGLFCIDDTKDADALNTSESYTQKQTDQKPAAKKQTATVTPIAVDSKELAEAFETLKPEIERAPSRQALVDIYNWNVPLHDYAPFKAAMAKRKKEVA